MNFVFGKKRTSMTAILFVSYLVWIADENFILSPAENLCWIIYSFIYWLGEVVFVTSLDYSHLFVTSLDYSHQPFYFETAYIFKYPSSLTRFSLLDLKYQFYGAQWFRKFGITLS